MSLCSKCDQPILAKGLCRKHYRAQPERAAIERAKHKEWLQKNKEYHNSQQAEYRKEYWASHREEARLRAAEWRKANPGAHKEQKREWQRNHPVEHKAATTNRRARLRSVEGKHTATQIRELFVKQDGRCAICDCVLPNSYHKDHIKPLALGGSNWIENIQLLCPTCNCSKGAKDPEVFMRERSLA